MAHSSPSIITSPEFIHGSGGSTLHFSTFQSYWWTSVESNDTKYANCPSVVADPPFNSHGTSLSLPNCKKKCIDHYGPYNIYMCSVHSSSPTSCLVPQCSTTGLLNFYEQVRGRRDKKTDYFDCIAVERSECVKGGLSFVLFTRK